MYYTEEELNEIYEKVCEERLDNKELKNIREALYLITPLAEFSPDLYQEVILSLKSVGRNSDKINYNFIELYAIYLQELPTACENYEVCSELVRALYTDLSKVKTNSSFDRLVESFLYLYPVASNNEALEIIKNINKPLGEILINSQCFFDNRPTLLDGINYIETINKIFREMMIIFLQNIDSYDYDYMLPSNVIMCLMDNRIDAMKVMELYYSKKDVRPFITALLNKYKEKGEDLFPRGKEKLKVYYTNSLPPS